MSGGGLYEVTYLIKVNNFNRLNMAGKKIKDKIISTKRLSYAGDGIRIKVIKPDNTIEERHLTWNQLEIEEKDGQMVGWIYTVPNNDLNYKYEIEYEAIIDMNGAPAGVLEIKNNSYLDKDVSGSSIKLKGDGIGFKLAKKAIEVSSSNIKWQIIVTVPGEGFDGAFLLTDAMPILQVNNKRYDDSHPESINEVTVDGLLPGEQVTYKNIDKRQWRLEFYKNSSNEKGLLAKEDGNRREIIITFDSQVNQEWLNLAHDQEYKKFQIHKNIVSLTQVSKNGDKIVLTANDQAVPKKHTIKKEYLSTRSSMLNGVTYPVYDYKLTLEGITDQSEQIIKDNFDIKYLRYLEGSAILKGINAKNQEVQDGNIRIEKNDTGITLVVSNLEKLVLHNKYNLYYSLIVKDQEALKKLNEEALPLTDGKPLENIAQWGEIKSDKIVVYHQYLPYVDKKITIEPTISNDYTVGYEIKVNKEAQDLVPDSDVITITDKLSDNLRLKQDTIKIVPENSGAIISFDYPTNTLTISNIPDGKTYSVYYDVKVLGKGETTFSNTASFDSYKNIVDSKVVIKSKAVGTGSNPSITVVKKDKDDTTKLLEGVQFQLFTVEDGIEKPIKNKYDKPIIFTTNKNGEFLVEGNQENLGWVLWANTDYILKEIRSLDGYDKTKLPVVKFILKKDQTNKNEFDLIGDKIEVTNERYKRDIKVTKQWYGLYGAKPQIQLQLYRQIKGGKAELVPEAEVKVLNDGDTEVTWDNLFKQDDELNEYIYTVKEVGEIDGAIEIDGTTYDVTYGGNMETGLTVVNRNNEKIAIPVEKKWVGPEQDSVTIHLLAEGLDIQTAVLNKDNNWQYIFRNVAKYNKDGREIAYSVTEENLNNYDVVITGDPQNGFIITNTIKGQVAIGITKKWVGPEQDKASILLFANNKMIDKVELNKTNKWQHTFKNLEEYQNGSKVVYAVQEEPLDGYKTLIEEVSANNFLVTNINAEKTIVEGIKIWDDNNDQFHKRPEKITINLLKNGVKIANRIVKKSEDWKWKFEGLDKYENGIEIVYSITEEKVENYSGKVYGYDIKNTYIPETPGEVPKTSENCFDKSRVPVNIPKTGQNARQFFSYLGFALIGITWLLVLLRRKTSKL